MSATSRSSPSGHLAPPMPTIARADRSWLFQQRDDSDGDGGHCATGCLFADFAGALHNLRFDLAAAPPRFVAARVGVRPGEEQRTGHLRGRDALG